MQSKRYSLYEDIVPRFFETRSSTPSIRKIRKFNNNNNDSQNSNDRKIFLSRNSMHVRRNGALRNIIPLLPLKRSNKRPLCTVSINFEATRFNIDLSTFISKIDFRSGMKLIRQHRDAVAVSDETREQAVRGGKAGGGQAACRWLRFKGKEDSCRLPASPVCARRLSDYLGASRQSGSGPG